MALHHGERRYISLDTAHTPHHGQGSYMHELMNTKYAADHSPIADNHMAGHRHPIGDHDPVA